MESGIDEALAFIRQHHRAVVIARRADGTPQPSPVNAAVDRQGRILISTRAMAAKVRNLTRDPRVTVLAVTDGWWGPWVTIDGRAEVVHLPQAEAGLIEQARQVMGEQPDWSAFRRGLIDQERVLIRITPTRAARPGR
jgi:PPOX class probable F420-dependent enzyme